MLFNSLQNPHALIKIFFFGVVVVLVPVNRNKWTSNYNLKEILVFFLAVYHVNLHFSLAPIKIIKPVTASCSTPKLMWFMNYMCSNKLQIMERIMHILLLILFDKTILCSCNFKIIHFKICYGLYLLEIFEVCYKIVTKI